MNCLFCWALNPFSNPIFSSAGRIWDQHCDQRVVWRGAGGGGGKCNDQAWQVVASGWCNAMMQRTLGGMGGTDYQQEPRISFVFVMGSVISRSGPWLILCLFWVCMCVNRRPLGVLVLNSWMQRFSCPHPIGFTFFYAVAAHWSVSTLFHGGAQTYTYPIEMCTFCHCLCCRNWLAQCYQVCPVSHQVLNENLFQKQLYINENGLNCSFSSPQPFFFPPLLAHSPPWRRWPTLLSSLFLFPPFF